MNLFMILGSVSGGSFLIMVSKLVVVNYFYIGLASHSKSLNGITLSGSLLNKSYDEAIKLIDMIDDNKRKNYEFNLQKEKG